MNSSIRGLMILCALLLVACPWSAAANETQPIGSFQLSDYLGTKHSLDDWVDKKAVVVIFMGTECPLAKLYGPRLADLAEQYKSEEVQFVGINSNQQDSLAEIAAFARIHKIEFPIVKDPGNQVADAFGAERTPEVFLLDAKRIVRYRGRIDDQYGVGYAREQRSRNDLAAALDELLAGKEITTPVTEAVGCYIGRVSRQPARGEVTYSNQVARVLQRNCTGCHRAGQIAPFALTSYDEVVGWGETICEVIDDRRMPPWHANPEHGKFMNDARLSDDEMQLLHRWVENGVPEGDPADLPDPPAWHGEWAIPQPDMVVKMPTAFKVPAKGVVDYKYFTVDPGFKEDKWIRAAEGRPGNTAVVHHLVLFFIPPGQSGPRPEDPLFNLIAGFAPGTPAATLPDGYARRIPAGSKLVFQMHYTPNGSEQTDLSEAGLVFADPATVRKEVVFRAALNWQFLIPPGASDHRVEATHRFDQDTELYALIPHMHLRGKSFQYTAIYPDQRREVLLDVPRYDFNWQNSYILDEPLLLPEGTELHCVAHFDNSADNLVNPDPTKAVHWGDQTWEEMMVGSFYMALAEQDLTIGPPRVEKLSDKEFAATFRYRATDQIKHVYLAGGFNDWNPTDHRMNGPDDDGWFTTTLKLPAGNHEYKFVLDGETWKHDPGNREQTGVYHNSVLFVGDEDARDAAKPKPKFTVGKETTFITQPLTKDGFPDYAAAINQRLSRGVTAENNANVLLWRAHGPHPERATMPPEFFELMGIESPLDEGDYLVDIGEFVREHLKIDDEERMNEIFDQQGRASSGPWKSGDLPHIAAWLKQNETPLKVAIEASRRSEYFSPLVVTDEEGGQFGLIGVILPGVQESREFARALSARAMLNLGEGRTEEAWRDLLACHRLGRLIGRGPTLIEGLVGIAIEGIALNADLALIEHTRPDAEQFAAYVRDLDALPPSPAMADKVDLGERFMFLDSVLMIVRGNAKEIGAMFGAGDGIDKLAGMAAGADLDWDIVLRKGNRLYDRLVAAMRIEDWTASQKALAAFNTELQDLAKKARDPLRLAGLFAKGANDALMESLGDILVALFMPALDAARSAEDRTQQQYRNLRIALALSAYREEHQRYPTELVDLAPKYLDPLPVDLFSGQPLNYQPRDDGYLLYSVGPNGQDDGGHFYDPTHGGDDPHVRMK